MGIAADETGKKRYNHKELTQSVIESLLSKIDIKSFTRKRGLREGSKKSDFVTKGGFYDRE